MELNQDAYYALLDTKQWNDFRRKFIRDKGYRCEICGKIKKSGLQVHHIRYYAGRKPWDYSDDVLQCLCIDCHRKLHLELHDRGMKIPVLDDSGERIYPKDSECCQHCGGSGFKEDFSYLLGGICFYCFGTGLRFAHRYTPLEARYYSLRIYHQWLRHNELSEEDMENARFSSAEDIEKWLLSMNDNQ